MIFVKYPRRAVFDFGRCHYGNGALGEPVCESGATLGIFESGDPWSHFSGLSMSIPLRQTTSAGVRTFTGFEDVWVRLVYGLSKLQLSSGDGGIASTDGQSCARRTQIELPVRAAKSIKRRPRKVAVPLAQE